MIKKQPYSTRLIKNVKIFNSDGFFLLLSSIFDHLMRIDNFFRKQNNLVYCLLKFHLFSENFTKQVYQPIIYPKTIRK